MMSVVLKQICGTIRKDEITSFIYVIVSAGGYSTVCSDWGGGGGASDWGGSCVGEEGTRAALPKRDFARLYWPRQRVDRLSIGQLEEMVR